MEDVRPVHWRAQVPAAVDDDDRQVITGTSHRAQCRFGGPVAQRGAFVADDGDRGQRSFHRLYPNPGSSTLISGMGGLSPGPFADLRRGEVLPAAVDRMSAEGGPAERPANLLEPLGRHH